jgi:nanoRNase/pAp phosphatase (c-di-AMP/oligoRNAs hydrolase)
MDGPIVISDFRIAGMAPPSNRFLIYSLYPDANISIRIIDGKGGEFVSLSVGYSVLNRTATVDVGSLMLKYGGGGHKVVGTCQVPYEAAEETLQKIVDFIKAES